MPRVNFTGNLQRHLSAPPTEVPGRTVGEALEAVFAGSPALRSYILDDQGAVRRHVAVFIGADAIKDRQKLSDAVPEGAVISVLQALSGG